MEIKKKKNSFNEYTLEVSYGELEAIKNSLQSNHTGPVADELYAGVCYYLERLDPPGVDTEEASKGGEGGGEAPLGAEGPGDDMGADDLLAAPPMDDADMGAAEGPPEGGAPEAGPPAESGEHAIDYDDPDSLLAAPPGA